MKMAMVFCRGCGKEIHETAISCPLCGATQQTKTSTRKDKDKVIAGLLALFLGGIGLHKFYLGRIGWGIAYLIFCWTFIPSIIAFVEAIIYFAMSQEKWDEKYNS